MAPVVGMKSKSTDTFKDVSVESIESQIDKLKSSLGESSHVGLSFSSQNMVVIASAHSDQAKLERLMGSLVKVHPARFFVLLYDTKIPEMTLNVAVSCQLISQEEHICSEIIKIRVGKDEVLRAAGLIRAHLVSGVSTDSLLFFDDSYDVAIVDQIVPLTDRVVFDSKRYDDLECALHLRSLTKSCVDIEWLRLSIWRTAIKQVFDLNSVASSLSCLDEIEIKSGHATKSFAELFLAGWLIHCLRFEVGALGLGYYELKTLKSDTVKLRFVDEKEDADLLELKFTMGSTSDACEVSSVQIYREDNRLRTDVNGTFIHRSEALLEDRTTSEQLSQFFLVGESLKHYDEALSVAVELETLRKGYTFAH
ncbi:MAG: glucose-6-phosphate dehydrogenase assembly protein OpcA [Deltaproteobacteria bacterium]|nr:glucose-6-phosphate dehydrogenase assembly protein OpcA [Deltaproteobacteria bacterium]